MVTGLFDITLKRENGKIVHSFTKNEETGAVTLRLNLIPIWEDGKEEEAIPLFFTFVNELRQSENGNFLFINNKKDVKWAASTEAILEFNSNMKPEQEWRKFDLDGATQARQGEYLFLQFYIALKQIDEKRVNLSDYFKNKIFEKLVACDPNVINDLFLTKESDDDFKRNNRCRVLIGVSKSNGMQGIYTKRDALGFTPFLDAGDVPARESKFVESVADPTYGWHLTYDFGKASTGKNSFKQNKYVVMAYDLDLDGDSPAPTGTFTY